RWPLVAAVALGVLLIALGGVAYAAYRYERANADLILPGTTTAGGAAPGMPRAEAPAAVRTVARQDLDREIVVFVDGERFTTTPTQLGGDGWINNAADKEM